MIIGFCGRLRSGKSELSKVCQKHGYQPLSFAIPLKELCADIYRQGCKSYKRNGRHKAYMRNAHTDDGQEKQNELCSRIILSLPVQTSEHKSAS